MVNSVQMHWGESEVPSGIPRGLEAPYHPTTGRGLEIKGGLSGPECGFACGERQWYLTFIGRFFLVSDRMPQHGRLFVSRPRVDFSGYLFARAWGQGAYLPGFFVDFASVKVGLRLRQTVYSGGREIRMKQVRRPRALNVEANPPSEHEAQQLYEPGTVHIPSLAWELERDKSLEIDIEVRFDMHLEGDCRLEFRNHNALGEMPQYPRHFMFDVPQWFIESCDTSPEEDDIREDTEPPPGRYFERNPL